MEITDLPAKNLFLWLCHFCRRIFFVGTKQMGKSSKKISSIKIQNFKIFKELNVNNLKRVNLIGGKNNIGKTAFLEAVEFFASSNNIYDVVINIARLVLKRQNKNRDYQNEIEFDLINYDSDSFIIKVDQNELIVKLIGPEFNQDIDIYIDNEEIIPEQLVEITFNQDIHKFPIRKLLHRRVLPPYRENVFKPKVNFISSSTINERDIATFYGELVDLGKENFLDNSLKLFDEKFIALKQKATKKDIILKLKIKDRDKPILLSSLGEGINRFVAILCAIWASKDGYLLIDEIENGIHYTNYEKLWQLIFKASKEANCQVFATTHSKECIEAFNNVNNKNEGVYLEFYLNKKTNDIVVKSRDYEQLSYSLSHQGRFRGE